MTQHLTADRSVAPAPPSRLPISTLDVISADRETKRALNVFCPELEETVSIERCSDCARCLGFDAGEGSSGRPVVLCGARPSSVPPRGAAVSVGRVLARHAVCVRDDASLDALDAVSLSDQAGIPVVDEARRLAGVLTPQDSATVQGIARQLTLVLDVSHRSHASLHERDSLGQALTRMAGTHTRRLPVIGRDGAVVGVLDDLDALRLLSASRD